jgi:hypothetical protein
MPEFCKEARYFRPVNCWKSARDVSFFVRSYGVTTSELYMSQEDIYAVLVHISEVRLSTKVLKSHSIHY